MLLNYNIGRFVLGSMCVGDLVRADFEWCPCCRQPATRTPLKTSSHQISNTYRTKNKTTNIVIQQHSPKILMLDILMSEAC